MKAESSKKVTGTGNPRGRGTYNPACDVCHRKKTKCDGVKPVCQPCRTSGRQLECSWTKNPARKPRTEQHFEAMHKRAENIRTLLIEYRRYADYLESLLDQRPQPLNRSVDFRASRPTDTDGLLGSATDVDNTDFDLGFGEEESAHGSEGPADPTKEICLPTQSLKLEEGGLIHHYGHTAPFRFNHVEPPPQLSRFPAIAQNPQATYVLIVDDVSEEHYNPDFDWSRHLPSAVPLDRRSHDRALDLLFKFFTSWCQRMVPALFLRDMYRALSVPKSHLPPKTPHYSPMLHNALVALALAFLDDPKFRDLKARQYFANTAKSFIEAECQKPNISVVQALSLLASFHSSQGDQTLGYMYFGMSARMSQALGLNVDCAEWVKLGLMEESDRQDRHWANWTTFNQDVCWSLYVGRDFCVPLPDPDFPMPTVDDDLDQMPWTHGPANIAPQPNYLTKNFQATSELLIISRRIMDVINCLNKTRARPFVIDELISDIDLKLNTWRGSLPQELEITVKSRPTATPHKLMLHLAYWWLFILLHRPFFHRKARPISSTDREIDHVKLCRRASENIMELLMTWRSLYSLRYCPITLIQTVFSAGTIYLLTAMQASSGVRIAQKELRHSLDQQKTVMLYLHEIGKSWQCATNIAGILKGLMQEQLKPLLERKTIPIQNGDSLQIPEYGDDDEDETTLSIAHPSSRGLGGPGHVRRRSSTSKTKQLRLPHSRSVSGSQSSPLSPTSTNPSDSPTITISPVHQAAPSYAPSSSLAQPSSVPISIHVPSKPSSYSSSPSSFVEIWNLRQGSSSAHAASPVSPSSRSSPAVSANMPSPSPSSASFMNAPSFQGYPQPFSYSVPDGPLFSSDVHGHNSNGNTFGNVFEDHGSLSSGSPFSSFGQQRDLQQDTSPSSMPGPSFPSHELAGFLGMLGGQTIPLAPFCSRFSLGDGTVAPLTVTATPSLDTFPVVSGSSGSLDQAPFGTGFLIPTLGSASLEVNTAGLDLDTNMDDLSQWVQLFAQDFS